MIKGSICALVTPLAADNQIDWLALERLVAWHLEAGTDGLVPVGTTGESATLNTVEHHQVIQQVVTWAAHRLAVIGGTGANSTLEALELTQAAEQAGVDACLLVTPYYNKPTQEGLFLHYKTIADAVSVPLILYNVPGRTSVDMTHETVLRLAALDAVVGIKDATGDVLRAQHLIDLAPASFAIYSGDDPTAANLMLMGGQGNISVTANVVPDLMSQLAVWCLAGESEKATGLQNILMPLHEHLFIESNPIPVKWALHEMGFIDKSIRLPLTPLSIEYRDALMASLNQAKQHAAVMLSAE